MAESYYDNFQERAFLGNDSMLLIYTISTMIAANLNLSRKTFYQNIKLTIAISYSEALRKIWYWEMNLYCIDFQFSVSSTIDTKSL